MSAPVAVPLVVCLLGPPAAILLGFFIGRLHRSILSERPRWPSPAATTWTAPDDLDWARGLDRDAFATLVFYDAAGLVDRVTNLEECAAAAGKAGVLVLDGALLAADLAALRRAAVDGPGIVEGAGVVAPSGLSPENMPLWNRAGLIPTNGTVTMTLQALDALLTKAREAA